MANVVAIQEYREGSALLVSVSDSDTGARGSIVYYDGGETVNAAIARLKALFDADVIKQQDLETKRAALQVKVDEW